MDKSLKLIGMPFDPNGSIFKDGFYHLWHLYRERAETGFRWQHLSSIDLFHWRWHSNELQHHPGDPDTGIFSGTGFITKDGRPAAIYHGQASGRNQIAVAKDNKLSSWEKPFPVEVLTKDGKEAEINHWDPDCFLIGDAYYAISGGQNPRVFKSKDLKNWIYIGDSLKDDMADVAIGEDISCPNFFKIGNKWMKLFISHPFGCRYYLGDWVDKNEQFVPQIHERMNWRKNDQSFRDIEIKMEPRHNGGDASFWITGLNGDSFEIKATISREQAINKRLGFYLFSDDKKNGFPVIINPVTRAIRVGTVEAPFFVDDLPSGEDLEIRIFIDKYLIEVFVNDRQAVVGTHMNYKVNKGLYGYTFGTNTTIKEMRIWVTTQSLEKSPRLAPPLKGAESIFGRFPLGSRAKETENQLS